MITLKLARDLDKEKLKSLADALISADETIDQVDNSLKRVEMVEREALAMINEVEQTLNNKFETVLLTLFIIELKAYIAFSTLLGVLSVFSYSQGYTSTMYISGAIAIFIILSALTTIYRYLGNDFIVDLLKIANPVGSNPDLEEEYQLNPDYDVTPTDVDLRDLASEKGYDSSAELIRELLEEEYTEETLEKFKI